MSAEHSAVAAFASFEPKLRVWQKTALEAWREGWSGTISVATGGGKTLFACACMREVLSSRPDARVLIIVPTLALLDQWEYTLTHDVGLSPGAVAIVTTDAQETRQVNLVVINTARALVPKLTSAGEWFLCVDECHRAGSPENSRALQGSFVATLGLSATPERQYDRGFQEYVVPVLGKIIYSYSIAQALTDGVVAPFKLRNYRIPLTEPETTEFLKLTRAIARELATSGVTPSGPSTLLERLLRQRASVIVSARWRVPAAVALAMNQNRPTILFHERIRAADEIVQMLEKRGRRVVAYHSSLSRGMRQRNLALFREGIADTLVTCRSLDEGFNVPEAEIGILAASSRSIRQRIQRLGRVIRQHPSKERAIVNTLYATDVEEQMLRSEMVGIREIAEVEWYDTGIAK